MGIVPPGAQLQHDTSPADWLITRLWPWGREVGTRVGAIAPEGFETYVRLFHRPGMPWSEIATRTGRTMHPLVQFDRFEWDERPPTGTLRRYEAQALVSALGGHTTSGRCCLAIWHGYGELSGSSAQLDGVPTFSTEGREYFLFTGAIDVVPRFELSPGHLQTPNIWWPDDRSWLVASEIDMDSTIVACSRACADALLGSTDLETAEVSIDGRLDHEGDTINPRPF